MKPLLFAVGLSLLCSAQVPQADMREKARSLLRIALAARNPDMRIKALQASSLIGPHEEVLTTLKAAYAVEKDVLTKIATQPSCQTPFFDQLM